MGVSGHIWLQVGYCQGPSFYFGDGWVCDVCYSTKKFGVHTYVTHMRVS